MEAWIYPTSFTGSAKFASLWSDRPGGAQFNRQFWMSSGRLYGTYGKTSSAFVHFSDATYGNLTLNEWQHVAYGRYGDNFFTTINGVLVGLSNWSGSVWNNSATIYVGQSNGYSDSRYYGYLHMRVYRPGFCPHDPAGFVAGDQLFTPDVYPFPTT